VCVCSLIYPAFSEHAPYYIVVCDLSGSFTFSTFSNKRHDFVVNVVETDMTQLVIAVRNFASAPKIVNVIGPLKQKKCGLCE